MIFIDSNTIKENFTVNTSSNAWHSTFRVLDSHLAYSTRMIWLPPLGLPYMALPSLVGTSRLLGYRRRQEQRAPSIYHGQSEQWAPSLCDFFQSRLTTGRSRAVRARPNLATLSFVLLVPLAFSPCPDTNGRIGLLAIGSSECLSLRLPWVNET